MTGMYSNVIRTEQMELWLGGSGEHETLPPLLFTWKILTIPTLSGILTLTGHKTLCGFQCFKKFSHYLSQPFHKKSSTQSKRPPLQEMEWKMFEKWQPWHWASISARFRSWQELSNLYFVWRLGERTWTKIRVDDACQTKQIWKNVFAFPWHGMWVSGVFGNNIPTRTARGQFSWD